MMEIEMMVIECKDGKYKDGGDRDEDGIDGGGDGRFNDIEQPAL